MQRTCACSTPGLPAQGIRHVDTFGYPALVSRQPVRRGFLRLRIEGKYTRVIKTATTPTIFPIGPIASQLIIFAPASCLSMAELE